MIPLKWTKFDDNFALVMPLPGTDIYKEWKKKIGVDTFEWDKFLYYQCVPLVSEIGEEKLKRYLKKAMIQFYLRPRIMLSVLSEIKTMHQLKVLLKRSKTILFGSKR